MENSSKKKRVLMIGNSHLVIFKFRKELIQQLVKDGYDVWVSFPNGPFGEGEDSSKEFGCNFVETKMNRRGKNPIQELALIGQYIRLLRKVKPDVVLTYTVKPDVYGGIACRLLKIPFIPNITGLGKGLDDGGLLRSITILLYKLAMRKAKCVFFQNEQDMEFFDTHSIKYRHSCLLPGSGVNLKEFIPLEYPSDETVRFTYFARVMKAKGIEQFLEAAKYINSKYNNVEFHICGLCEEDYRETIMSCEGMGIVKYHGLVNNVLEYIKDSHCIVLPTYHPEGISNVLLEAAACARPLITTNRVGCRETVDNGLSGYLVRERDSQDLIEKLEMFLRLSLSEKVFMGRKGREKIENYFDRNIVVDKYIKEISQIR